MRLIYVIIVLRFYLWKNLIYDAHHTFAARLDLLTSFIRTSPPLWLISLRLRISKRLLIVELAILAALIIFLNGLLLVKVIVTPWTAIVVFSIIIFDDILYQIFRSLGRLFGLGGYWWFEDALCLLQCLTMHLIGLQQFLITIIHTITLFQSPIILIGAQSNESYVSKSLSLLNSLLAFFGRTDENDLKIFSPISIPEYSFVSFFKLLTLQLASPRHLVGKYDEVRTNLFGQLAVGFGDTNLLIRFVHRIK